MDIKSIDKKYVANTYSRADVVITKGKGSTLYGGEKKYIDFGSGIAVNGLGVCNELWVKAVCEQAAKLPHASNLYYTENCALLAEMLCNRTGMKKVFFSNSGAEANECAIKTARKYSFDKYGKDRADIITLKNSFHGRTMATLSATGQEVFHNYFFPFLEGFKFVSAGIFQELEACADEHTCAVMLELVQGEGGVLPLNNEYAKKVSELCNKKDILLIIDEVQTGNGRTGELYAYMKYGISPDIVTTAKGLGGGLPIGATMFNEKTENTLSAGMHGSTFGGNPIAAAGAIAILKQIDEKLLCGVNERSEYIIKKLGEIKGVKAVSGLGLMLGFETEKPVKQVLNDCLERGLIVLSAKNKVRLLPALNIPYEDIDKGMNILKEVLE